MTQLLTGLQRKDEPPREAPESTPAAGASPKPAVQASDYRNILVEGRLRQLRVTRDAIKRLQRVYDAAQESILAKIRRLPAGQDARREALLNLLLSIGDEMRQLAQDYRMLLGVGMTEVAQAAADREAQALELVGRPIDPALTAGQARTVTLSANAQAAGIAAEIEVRFGQVALRAVNAVAGRYYRDGLQLSDRLHRLSDESLKVIEDVIVQGVTEGVSARELATRLQDAMGKAGSATPRYNAMRIARTEINNAYREGHAQSLIDPTTGELKEWALGIRWSLSLSHPEADICDVWAAHDEGLGPGVYSPGTLPVDHPHGLCFTTTELVDVPRVTAPGKKPNVDAVPDSEIAYYATRLGDVPAAMVAQARAERANRVLAEAA